MELQRRVDALVRLIEKENDSKVSGIVSDWYLLNVGQASKRKEKEKQKKERERKKRLAEQARKLALKQVRWCSVNLSSVRGRALVENSTKGLEEDF